MFEPKNILVPTDFSEHSDKALRQALDIAEKFNSKVFLLHVVDKGIHQCVADYCLPKETMDQLERESVSKSRELMEHQVDMVAGRPAVEVAFDVQKGVPYDVILQEQQKKGIDLIVIASHGKSGLMGHLMGSVADRVAERAKSEVLIVRA